MAAVYSKESCLIKFEKMAKQEIARIIAILELK